MRIIVNEKTMVADEATCNAFTGIHGNGSVTFLTDVPKNAIVVDVLVNGKSIENYRLDEWRRNGNKCEVFFPANESFDGQRVVAVFVDETCSGELYALAFSGGIENIEVKYVKTAEVTV